MKQNIRAAMFAFYIIGSLVLVPMHWAVTPKSLRECWREDWQQGLDLLHGRSR